MEHDSELPPGQQRVAGDKWPLVGERESAVVPATWTLAIHGCVDHPCRWTLDEVQQLPQVRPTVDIHCVTRWSKLGVSFTGVLLRDVLHAVGVDPAARYVSFESHSTRGHTSSLALATALELGTFLAWEVDGRPLPAMHGGPLRNIVPGRYFYKSVKWLCGLELLVDDRLGYWEADAGYHNEADPWREQRYLAADLDKRRVKQLLATRDFSGLDLRGFQAADRELDDLVARDAKLRDANFRGCRLQRADFRGANLSNAHFQGAKLVDAKFQGADVEGTNFCQADLRGCDFSEASLFGASFVVENWQALPEDQWQAAQLTNVRLTPQQIESLATSQVAYLQRLVK